MDNKGQGPIGFIFVIIVFLLLWFLWIGEWIAQVGEDAIAAGQLTGIEAFFYANLNVIVLLGLMLGTIGFMYWVSSG